MSYKIPRLLFAAPKSGSGKTLITCGFLEAVKRRGHILTSFKCGPDYIDPMFHKYVLGVSGGNLDSFFLDKEQVREMFVHMSSQGTSLNQDKALSVIEGVMGYYDGLGGISTEASTYEIAKITDTPVILVLDCKGASLSLAAVVKGFLEYKEDSRIKGVILNRMPTSLYKKMIPIIQKTGVKVYGYLPENADFILESRHLGLLMPEEIDRLQATIGLLAEQMEETIDLDGLISLAQEAPELSLSASRIESVKGEFFVKKTLKIGVARDSAFCFYYQENLKLMEKMGAELIYFSPLTDSCIPKGISGLLFGGGYPENFAKELSENYGMLESVRTACKNQMPVLAECGGFLYLHRSLTGSDKKIYQMAGVVDATAFPTGKLSRFGYITLSDIIGLEIKGHEFHYWDSENPGDAAIAVKPAGDRSWRCMHIEENRICGFPHLYYPSNPELLSIWLDNCRKYEESE